MRRQPPKPTSFPYTTPSGSHRPGDRHRRHLNQDICGLAVGQLQQLGVHLEPFVYQCASLRHETRWGVVVHEWLQMNADRKSTRLNSSHANISYAVFCLNTKT